MSRSVCVKLIGHGFPGDFLTANSRALLLAALCLAGGRPARAADEFSGFLAVLEVDSRLKGADAEALDRSYLSDRARRIARHLLPRARILTRQNMEVLAKNRGTSLEECMGLCAVEAARKLDADAVISGELLKIGHTFRLTLNLYSTQDANLLSSEEASGTSADALVEQLDKAVTALLAPLSHPAAPKAPAEPAATPGAAAASAQAEGTLFGPVAQVDVQRAVVEVPDGKTARAQLKEELAAKRAIIDRKQQSLQQLKDQYDKDAAALSPAEKQRRTAAIQQAYEEAKQFAEHAQEDLRGKEQAEMTKISRKLLAVTAKVAEAANLSFVFDRAAVLSAPDDVTAEAIAVYGGAAAAQRAGAREPLAFGYVDLEKAGPQPQNGKAPDDAAKAARLARVRELAARLPAPSPRKLVLDKSALLYGPAAADATATMSRAFESGPEAIGAFSLPVLRGTVAYVDVQRCVQEVAEGKAAKARLKAELAERRGELDRSRSQLERMKAEYDRQAPSLPDEAKKQRQAELQKAYAAAQALGARMQEELGAKEQQAMNGISARMLQTIARIAEREHAALVVDKAALLYAPAAADLTNDLIRGYDAQFPAQ